MTDLYSKYRDQGLEILAFPCNQFLNQEPWPEAQIAEWTATKFGREFDLFSKIDVNGENTHPTFVFLKKCFPGDITWNFHGRFLVNRAGIPVKRFDEKDGWDVVE